MVNDTKKMIREAAFSEGFDMIGITDASSIPYAGSRLDSFLQRGYHGEMHWLAETAERRKSPTSLWNKAKTVIVLGINYGPDENPLNTINKPESGSISVYARNRDYHDLIKGKLKRLATRIVNLTGSEVKIFVDTAPVMEKPLAEAAGIGWQGKHTNLVSRRFGSWLLLGEIFTNIKLEPDQQEIKRCGSCRACIDICPTNAFPEPYKLDARRCIAYLTIEHKGIIDPEFRSRIGNRIYGCDDCLAICPWNKFAKKAQEAKLKARQNLTSPQLEELVKLDDTKFRLMFSGSPIKRIGRNRFMRNVLIAIGNSGNTKLVNTVKRLLDNEPALVRGMAIWALSQLLTYEDFIKLRAMHAGNETNVDILNEWNRE